MGDRQTLYLSWIRPAQGADSYQIEQSVGGGSFTVLKTVSGANSDSFISTSSYPDDGQINFRVCGISGSDRTAYSNVASFRMWVRAPGNVTAWAGQDQAADGTIANKVELTWTRNALTSTGVRIDRIVSGSGTTTVATLSPGSTFWRDMAPVEGSSTTYTVTNLCGTAASDPAWSNGLIVPIIPPVIASVVPSGGTLTLTWSKSGAPADQMAVLFKTGLDSTYLDSYSTLATLAGDATTYTAAGLPAGYLSIRVKAFKDGQSGVSKAWSYAPAPTVPGTSFGITSWSFPSANIFALSSSGRCLAQETLLSPPRVFEVENGTYASNFTPQGGDSIASAAAFDGSQEPHFFLWRPSSSVSGQWDLLHLRRQGTAWSSEPTGRSTTTPSMGVALMDASNNLHFIYAAGSTYQHLTNASGSWVFSDTGLASGGSAPWAASLDGTGLVRVFAGSTTAGTTAGRVAARSAGGNWTIETVAIAFQSNRTSSGDMVALPNGRLGLAALIANAASTTECWWFERETDGTWSVGQKLGTYGSIYSGAAFMLAASPDASRAAVFLNDSLFLRDAAGTWTSGTFCPIGYQTGPLTLAFTTQNKLKVLCKGGSAGYYFLQPYLLYEEQ